MKPIERDELLIRLDERSLNMWHILEEEDESIHKQIDKILDGQKTQNGAILKNTIWRKAIVFIGTPVVIGIVGWLLKLTLT